MWGPILASFESLVAQVKELQWTSPDAKEEWRAYTDQKGGRTRDPSRHSADFLQDFLNHVSSGHRLTPNQGSSLGGSCAPSEQNPTLVESIEALQSRSEVFQDIWSKHCEVQGAGNFVPSKHSTDFLLQFLAQLAEDAELFGGGSVGGEPPMKRMRGLSSVGGGGSSGIGDPEKDDLVARIKAFQKSGAQQKELWCSYADTYLQGWRDPARHDASALREFCTSQDVPNLDVSAASEGLGLGGFGCGSTPTWPQNMAGLGQGQMSTDPVKERLVTRIKAFQKMGIENADTWKAFCGPTKDPKLHDTEKLQEFCKLFAVL